MVFFKRSYVASHSCKVSWLGHIWLKIYEWRGLSAPLPTLRFSHVRSSIQALIISFFSLWRLNKSTDLTKLLIPIQIRFSNSVQSFVYILEIYIARKRKNFLNICMCYFLDWKYFSGIWKNNSSLSKPTLKNLLYCQVFWFKVRRLQDQCRSRSTLVFYYFFSNILQRCQKYFTTNVMV